MADLRAIALALGGVVSGRQVLAPTPGHGPADRGTVITLSPGAPDGVLIHTFNGNQADVFAVKDQLRAAGLLPSREGINRELSPTERARLAEQRAQAEAQAEARQHATWAHVARECRERLARAQPADPGHPYLTARRIAPKRLWQDERGCLLAPMTDYSGTVWNLQAINPDGKKRFTKNALCKGLFWWVGSMRGAGRIAIAEGVANAAAAHQAMGVPAVAAMSAHNLTRVARTIRAQCPNAEILFITDPEETGEREAYRAAESVGGLLVPFGDMP